MKRDRSFLDIYFDEIAKIPLLNREEEIDCGKNIRRYAIKKELLAQLIKKGERISNASYLANRFQLLLDKYTNRLIQSNYRLVVSIAKRYRNEHLQLNDLIEEGNFGLFKAVERFDHRMGFRFSTFAIRWIKQCITKAISDKGRTVRIPVHIDKIIKRYKKIVAEYHKKHGVMPENDYVEHEMGLKYEKIKEILDMPRQIFSLDLKVSESEKEMYEFVESDERYYEPESQTMDLALKETIDKMLKNLTEKEAKIITLRYGLDGQTPLTLGKIGEKLRMSRERIRQIQTVVLKKMRHMDFCQELKSFIDKPLK